MDKLKELLGKCKCEITLTVNSHRNVYQSAADYLKELDEISDDFRGIDPAVRAKMIELDTVINIIFYPKTPVGSYSIYHYDLDAALDEALACLEKT